MDMAAGLQKASLLLSSDGDGRNPFLFVSSLPQLLLVAAMRISGEY
jgi:hypothetical protein